MIVLYLLIMMIIVMYVFLNYEQKKDNFLSKEILLDSDDNWKFKKIEIKKILSNKQKYKDVDELMNKYKHGETIYDVTSV